MLQRHTCIVKKTIFITITTVYSVNYLFSDTLKRDVLMFQPEGSSFNIFRHHLLQALAYLCPVHFMQTHDSPLPRRSWRCTGGKMKRCPDFSVRGYYSALKRAPVLARQSGSREGCVNKILPLDLCFEMVVAVQDQYIEPVEVINAASNNREKEEGNEVSLRHRPHGL